MPDLIPLSASRINTFLQCSWVYYCKYILGLRDDGNDGQRRGSVVHSVFEMLLRNKRREYVKKILKKKTVTCIPSLETYIGKLCLKNNLIDEYDNKGNHNLKLIDEMIVVGLGYDFYCDKEGDGVEQPETEFDYTHPENKYRIVGFIDKIAKYGKKLGLWDYKSSSEKYVGDDVDFNIQAMMYSLYAKRVRDAECFVRFFFLRHGDNPFIDLSFKDDDLVGFEHYLEYISNFLQDFTKEKGMSDMAYDKGFTAGFTGRTVCGRAEYPGQLKKNGDKMWCCSYKHPFIYYEVMDDGGKRIIASTNKEKAKAEAAKNPRYTIQPKQYVGCPRFRYLISKYPLEFSDYFLDFTLE